MASSSVRCDVHRKAVRELRAENARLQELALGLADRVAAQSELLSRRAEGPTR